MFQIPPQLSPAQEPHLGVFNVTRVEYSKRSIDGGEGQPMPNVTRVAVSKIGVDLLTQNNETILTKRFCFFPKQASDNRFKKTLRFDYCFIGGQYFLELLENRSSVWDIGVKVYFKTCDDLRNMADEMSEVLSKTTFEVPLQIYSTVNESLPKKSKLAEDLVQTLFNHILEEDGHFLFTHLLSWELKSSESCKNMVERVLLSQPLPKIIFTSDLDLTQMQAHHDLPPLYPLKYASQDELPSFRYRLPKMDTSEPFNSTTISPSSSTSSTFSSAATSLSSSTSFTAVTTSDTVIAAESESSSEPEPSIQKGFTVMEHTGHHIRRDVDASFDEDAIFVNFEFLYWIASAQRVPEAHHSEGYKASLEALQLGFKAVLVHEFAHWLCSKLHGAKGTPRSVDWQTSEMTIINDDQEKVLEAGRATETLIFGAVLSLVFNEDGWLCLAREFDTDGIKLDSMQMELLKTMLDQDLLPPADSDPPQSPEHETTQSSCLGSPDPPAPELPAASPVDGNHTIVLGSPFKLFIRPSEIDSDDETDAPVHEPNLLDTLVSFGDHYVYALIPRGVVSRLLEHGLPPQPFVFAKEENNIIILSSPRKILHKESTRTASQHPQKNTQECTGTPDGVPRKLLQVSSQKLLVVRRRRVPRDVVVWKGPDRNLKQLADGNLAEAPESCTRG